MNNPDIPKLKLRLKDLEHAVEPLEPNRTSRSATSAGATDESFDQLNNECFDQLNNQCSS